MFHIIFLTKFIFKVSRKRKSSKGKKPDIIIQGVFIVEDKAFFLIRVFFNFINSVQCFDRKVKVTKMNYSTFVF